MRDLMERLNGIRFEGTRRAVAGLCLSLFIALYLLVSLNPPPGWGPAFIALAACYLIAFVGVVAEWFWGRWFAAGLGWSGVMVAGASLAMIGWLPQLAIYGGLHALIVLTLTGKSMAARYDLQANWRERYGMDEFAVARLRKTVTRASASLPTLILYALAPKEGDGQGILFAAAGIGALLLAAASLRGLILLRTWGVLTAAVAAAGLWILGTSSSALVVHPYLRGDFGAYFHRLQIDVSVGALFSATLLTLAVLPFAGPAVRFVRARR